MPSTSSKFALVVGNNRHDLPGISPLITAEADAERVHNFLKSTWGGPVETNSLICLKSPDCNSVKIHLDRLAKESSKTDSSVLLLYFACHGILNDKDGVRLLFRDFDPEGPLLTTLSIRSIASTLSEYQCRASITILDVCHSGGHQQGISELSFGEILRKEGLIPDGHFILSSTSPDQTAKEDAGGGKFTTILLEVVEEVGKRFTYLPELPIDTICASVIDASKHRLTNQTPVWSGVSISKGIGLCANLHWDAQASAPYTAVTFKEINNEDREHFRETLIEVNGLIGKVPKGEFQSLIGQIEALACSSASDDSKSILLKRISETLLAKHISTDLPDHIIEVFKALITFQSLVTGPESYQIRELTFHVSEFSHSLLNTVPTWRTEKGWLGKGIGPSSIGLAPILFWSKLGTLAMVSLCCRLNGKDVESSALVNQIIELTKFKPELIRISWGGQYADVALVIATIAASDKTYARDLLQTLFTNFSNTKPLGMPAPVYLETDLLGEYFGMYYSGSNPQERFEYWGDEFLTLYLSLNLLMGISPLEVNSLIGKLQSADEKLGDLLFYNVPAPISYFKRMMTDAVGKQWVRESQDSISKFPDEMAEVFKTWKAMISQQPLQFSISLCSAARTYRNRCGIHAVIGIIQ
jgi:hypothetical protein